MAFVAAPNIVKVEIFAEMDGQKIENVLHVNVYHAPTAGDLSGLTAFFTAFLNTTYAPLLPDACTITGLRMTSLETQNDIQLETALTIPGTAGGSPQPNEVTYCVSIRSGLIGRSARGRLYVLGLVASQLVSQNRVSSTYRTAITTAFQTLIDDIHTAGDDWVIVSYVNNGAPRPGGPVYFIAKTAVTTDDVVDSQRRRKPGVGT